MIVAYFFDRHANVQLTQVFGVFGCEVTEKISDVSSATFSLPHRLEDGSINQDIRLDILQEMNRVELWKMGGRTEEKIFSGYIASVEASWESIKIHLNSLVWILEHRVLKVGKKFQGVALRTLLQTVWSEMLEAPCTLECNENTTITKSYEIGRSVLDILRDITNAGYEYRLEWNTLRVGKNIGDNRSDSVQYRKEWHSPAEWNIAEVTSAYHSKNTHNYVLTKIATSPPYSVEDTESIARYGRKEKYLSVSGDQGVTPSGYLAEHKASSREISLKPIDARFTHIAVGDFVGVYIDSGNDILHFSGVVKVREKIYRHGDLDEVEIVVATSSAKNPTILEKIKTLDSRVSTLENTL